MDNTVSSSNASTTLIIQTSLAKEIGLIQEHHPKIYDKITQMWGSVDLQNYLDSIIFDQRGGRHGFTDSVGAAIFKIYETHGKLFPPKKTGDVWDVILKQIE
jgi:hypothetical protein